MKNILGALFDVRPVNVRGVLDMEKIAGIKKVLDLRGRRPVRRAAVVKISLKEARLPITWDELSFLSGDNPEKEKILGELAQIELADREAFKAPSDSPKEMSPAVPYLAEQFYFPEVAVFKREKAASGKAAERIEEKRTVASLVKQHPKPLLGFLLFSFLIALIVPTFAWVSHSLEVKDEALGSGLSAYENLLAARTALESFDWRQAEQNFGLAQHDFLAAREKVGQLGRLTLGILERLPGKSAASSGARLLRVGEGLAQAGRDLSSAAAVFPLEGFFDSMKPVARSQDVLASRTSSLTEAISISRGNVSRALNSVRSANLELAEIAIDSLPSEIREGANELKQNLPLLEEILIQAEKYSAAFLEILGHDNPRQYLLVFQNNGEARATGGFIGTYGLLTLDQGAIGDLFIDGVFNADGQLHEKIIPPKAIQKISTAWSMHDANWFADFPASAQKIEWFYEKTGGPTVDGVISVTPALIERLLELTGPIEMPEYDTTLDAANFVEIVQYKVEVDYDKKLNQPKKILADFAPKFIDRLAALADDRRQQAVEIIFDCLSEKHILVFFNEPALEEMAVNEGWAGELLAAERDYVSVVSSNINGFKSDKMIKETVTHRAEIQPDGAVVDTLTVLRQHQGGDAQYDWWNRVNANYLRVYLPLGAELISASGQTIEVYQPPIDYAAEKFKPDPLVAAIEGGMATDHKSGTQIFVESGKTVFANWVYVSPGEQVELTYKYRLPFKIDLTKSSDSYSLVAQKQAGSAGSIFRQLVKFPTSWRVSWRHPEDAAVTVGQIDYVGDLTKDKFLGATFEF